jgi:di/tricarboxylate transporter
VAGAASLLSPIATPANVMVIRTGWLGDNWKLGRPVMALWLAVSLPVIPPLWRF